MTIKILVNYNNVCTYENQTVINVSNAHIWKGVLWSLVKLLGAHKVYLHIYNQLLYRKKKCLCVRNRLSDLEFWFKFFFWRKLADLDLKHEITVKFHCFSVFPNHIQIFVESTKSGSDGWFTSLFWKVSYSIHTLVTNLLFTGCWVELTLLKWKLL